MRQRAVLGVCVLLCCGCGPLSVQAQQASRGSISQRISQWMVGRMGLGGIPGASIPGFGMPSITGMSGLGGFFGMSPIGSGLLSVMGLGTRSQPTYVPAPSAPPPPPPPPPPAPPSSAAHAPVHEAAHHHSSPPHPGSARGPPPHSHGPRPPYHQPHGGYSTPVHRPPPSAYHGPSGPYRGSAPISHGLPPPMYSGPPIHIAAHRYVGPSYRGPSPNGGFYRGRGARGPRYLFAEDASFGRPHISPAIPIVIPRHAIRGPIRGPVAVKTPLGLMLGPFHKPVHQHGLPTIGDTPVIMDDVSSMTGGLGMHDLIDSSAMSSLSGLSTMDQLSMKDLMMTSGQASEDTMLGLDDALPFTVDAGDMDMFDKGGLSLGSLGGDALLSDTMKVSELGGELGGPALMQDDLKSLDLKENLLASASERQEHRQLIHGGALAIPASLRDYHQGQQRHQQHSSTAVIGKLGAQPGGPRPAANIQKASPPSFVVNK